MESKSNFSSAPFASSGPLGQRQRWGWGFLGVNGEKTAQATLAQTGGKKQIHANLPREDFFCLIFPLFTRDDAVHGNGTPIPMPAPPRSMWLRLSVRWGFASISISISSFFFRGGGGGETALRPLHFYGSGPVCLRLSLRSAVIVMWRKAQPSLPTIQQERANEQQWGRDFLHPRGDEISLGKEAPDRLYQKLASISKKGPSYAMRRSPSVGGKENGACYKIFHLCK